MTATTRALTSLNPRIAGWTAVLCAMMLLVGPPAVRADDENQDLQGILPDYIPDGLSEGAFTDLLAGNWAEWAQETGRLVSEFYASDNDEVRGRRETLERIQAKLQTMRTALQRAEYLPIYGPLSDLYGRLSRRIGVAEALLETVEQDVTAPSEVRVKTTLGSLAEDARALRSHFGTYNGGVGWANYLRLEEVAAAAQQGAVSDGTLQLASHVRQKLNDREQLDDVQREFLSHEPVLQFEDSVSRFVSLVQVDDPGGRQQQLRDLAATLMGAIEAYEEEPTAQNMSAVRHAFDDLRRLTPDGAVALTQAMRKHYLNYNVFVVVDESLAQDLVRDSRLESGFINQMTSQAHITGCQWTNTTVNLDLKPSNSGVRFDLVLNGNVRSQVRGDAGRATVYASGWHYFNGRKAVAFDGDRFASWPARVSVGGSTNPYAARTHVSWVPILGRISERIALNVASSPENNQQARNQVYQEARSQFDRETAEMLNEAEMKLESDLNGPLREEGYFPDVRQFSSTESEFKMRARVMESGEMGGSDIPPLPISPARGILVQAHESLLNQVGSRLELNGKRFTPDQFEQYLKDELAKVAGEPVDLGDLFSESEDEPSDSPRIEELIFHEVDALRFQVRRGEVVLILNMGMKLEGREEIEPQRITIPLGVTLMGETVLVERGTVGVSPIGRVEPRDRAGQIARAGVMRSKIQEVIETQEVDATLDTTIQDRTLTLRVTDLRASGGWLSLIATDGVSRGPSTPSQPQQYAQGTAPAISR